MVLKEEKILEVIERVIRENRKVLRVPSASSAAPAQPQEPLPDMGQMPVDGGMPMDAPMPPQDPNGGEQMPSDFDTNFDAGVEADEEADPKKYIQQLTGKLSQSINSFNNEQGEDTGLCKYVASMIITATCKSLDEKAKKELIEKINTASSDEGEEEMPEAPAEEAPEEMPAEEEPQPMNEAILTKKQLRELASQLSSEDNISSVSKNALTGAWAPKMFKK